MAEDDGIIEDIDLDDEGGDSLPSFSGGGGLPSFSGGSSSTFTTARKSPNLLEGGGGGDRQVGKKNKREAELAADDTSLFGASSPGEGGVGKKAKKAKKTVEEKKADKDDQLAKGTTKSPAKGKGKATKDSKRKSLDGGDEDGGDDAEVVEDKGAEKEKKAEGDVRERKEGDEDVDGDDDGEEEWDVDEDEKYKDEFRQRETELFNSSSEEEWKRYEAMRQAKFNEQGVKQILAHVVETQPATFDKPVLFTISGVAKIFVGELVDNARLVRREWGEDESEPLQPRHIREASHRLARVHQIPGTGKERRLFRR